MLHILEKVGPGIIGDNPLLDDAMRLRKEVFIDELKWPHLMAEDGREIDQFDTADAVYLIVTSGDDNRVLGNLRLLPTSKPHLLSTVHRGLWSRPYPMGLHCWEWTRYAIGRQNRGGKSFSDVASDLTLGAVEWGLENGVHDVVVEYDVYLITRFAELGFDITPLGLPVEMEGRQIIAVHMNYGEQALKTLRDVRKAEPPVAVHQVAGQRISRSGSDEPAR